MTHLPSKNMTEGPEMSSTAIMTLCNVMKREAVQISFPRKKVVGHLYTHPSFAAADTACALVADDSVLRLDQTQLLNDGLHVSVIMLRRNSVAKSEPMR